MNNQVNNNSNKQKKDFLDLNKDNANFFNIQNNEYTNNTINSISSKTINLNSIKQQVSDSNSDIQTQTILENYSQGTDDKTFIYETEREDVKKVDYIQSNNLIHNNTDAINLIKSNNSITPKQNTVNQAINIPNDSITEEIKLKTQIIQKEIPNQSQVQVKESFFYKIFKRFFLKIFKFFGCFLFIVCSIIILVIFILNF